MHASQPPTPPKGSDRRARGAHVVRGQRCTVAASLVGVGLTASVISAGLVVFPNGGGGGGHSTLFSQKQQTPRIEVASAALAALLGSSNSSPNAKFVLRRFYESNQEDVSLASPTHPSSATMRGQPSPDAFHSPFSIPLLAPEASASFASSSSAAIDLATPFVPPSDRIIPSSPLPLVEYIVDTNSDSICLLWDDDADGDEREEVSVGWGESGVVGEAYSPRASHAAAKTVLPRCLPELTALSSADLSSLTSPSSPSESPSSSPYVAHRSRVALKVLKLLLASKGCDEAFGGWDLAEEVRGLRRGGGGEDRKGGDEGIVGKAVAAPLGGNGGQLAAKNDMALVHSVIAERIAADHRGSLSVLHVAAARANDAPASRKEGLFSFGRFISDYVELLERRGFLKGNSDAPPSALVPRVSFLGLVGPSATTIVNALASRSSSSISGHTATAPEALALLAADQSAALSKWRSAWDQQSRASSFVAHCPLMGPEQLALAAAAHQRFVANSPPPQAAMLAKEPPFVAPLSLAYVPTNTFSTVLVEDAAALLTHHPHWVGGPPISSSHSNAPSLLCAAVRELLRVAKIGGSVWVGHVPAASPAAAALKGCSMLRADADADRLSNGSDRSSGGNRREKEKRRSARAGGDEGICFASSANGNSSGSVGSKTKKEAAEDGYESFRVSLLVIRERAWLGRMGGPAAPEGHSSFSSSSSSSAPPSPFHSLFAAPAASSAASASLLSFVWRKMPLVTAAEKADDADEHARLRAAKAALMARRRRFAAGRKGESGSSLSNEEGNAAPRSVDRSKLLML